VGVLDNCRSRCHQLIEPGRSFGDRLSPHGVLGGLQTCSRLAGQVEGDLAGHRVGRHVGVLVLLVAFLAPKQ